MSGKINILPFEPKYRDDLIFMVLEAKNALGRIPGLNEDLLDINTNYTARGGMFWVALNDRNRVVGSVGYNPRANPCEADLHRLFVKYNLKRQGIGAALLQCAETHMRGQNIKTVYVHLGHGEEWFESRAFYRKHGYVFFAEDRMKKDL